MSTAGIARKGSALVLTTLVGLVWSLWFAAFASAAPAPTETIFAVVPADAKAVVALDTEGLLALITDPASDLFELTHATVSGALSDMFEDRFGVRVDEIQQWGLYRGFDQSWAVVGLGPVEGQLSGTPVGRYRDATVVRWETMSRWDPDLFAMTNEYGIVVGQVNALAGVLDVIYGQTRSLAEVAPIDALLADRDTGAAIYFVDQIDLPGVAGEAIGLELDGYPTWVAMSASEQGVAVSLAFDTNWRAEPLVELLAQTRDRASSALVDFRVAALEMEVPEEELERRVLYTLMSRVLEGLEGLEGSEAGSAEIRIRGQENIVHIEIPGAPLLGWALASGLPELLSFEGYSTTGRLEEAHRYLEDIFYSATAYYDARRWDDPTGAQFPAPAPMTPNFVPCGRAMEIDYRAWDQPTWRALYFDIWEPQRFSYSFDSSGVGGDASFTAYAYGDLDCDGIYSTHFRVGLVGEGGMVTEGEGGEIDPLE